MRSTWVVLVLLAVLPALGFYVLDWTGSTYALRYVSTTTWQVGSPSVFDLCCLAASLVTWLWLRLFMFVFLLAAFPFALGDLVRALRRRGLNRKELQQCDA